MIRDAQAHQSFQVRTDHDDGGYQISIFLPLGAVLARGEQQIHLGDAQLQDEVGQQLPFPERAPEKLQAASPLKFVFLQLRWRIIADDVNPIVSSEWSFQSACLLRRPVTHQLTVERELPFPKVGMSRTTHANRVGSTLHIPIGMTRCAGFRAGL